MKIQNRKVGQAYYEAMGARDLGAIEQYLHDNCTFDGPLAKLQGKEAILKSIEELFGFFQHLEVKASFGSEEQAMLAWELTCPEPIGSFAGASLLNIENGKIKSIKLYYDSLPFQKAADQIFG